MHSSDSQARFLLATLATWRITHLLAEEDGPGDIVVRARERVGAGALGSLMDCFNCLSFWVAVPVSAALARKRRLDPLAWLALSGAACLLEQATRGHAHDAELAQAPRGRAHDAKPRQTSRGRAHDAELARWAQL